MKNVIYVNKKKNPVSEKGMFIIIIVGPCQKSHLVKVDKWFLKLEVKKQINSFVHHDKLGMLPLYFI